MVKRLTDEQRAKIDAVCERLYAQANSTEPLDQGRCRAAVARAYEAQNLEVPAIEFLVSPGAAMARLIACSPGDSAAMPGGNLSSLFGMLGSALPQNWPALGEEIDTACAHDLRNFREQLPWDRKLGQLVESRVGRSKLEAFRSAENAARESLQPQIPSEGENWLLYTAAHQSFWSEVRELASLECAIELGGASQLPPTVAASRELMPLSVSIYTFEKLCLVCERPAAIEVGMNPRETFAHLTWRDGTRADHHFEYDNDDEGDDEGEEP